MKKFLVLVALIVFAFSAQAALTQTYLKKKLSARGISSVGGVVDMYLTDTGQVGRVNAAKVSVLLNGKPNPGASEHLKHAEKVEVSSSNGSIVINVITLAPRRGA